MTLTEILILIAASVIAVPFVVYFTVKLGTYAYYQGKRQFHNDHPNG